MLADRPAAPARRPDKQPLRHRVTIAEASTHERLLVRRPNTTADIVAPQPSLQLAPLDPLTQAQPRRRRKRPLPLRALLSFTTTAKEFKGLKSPAHHLHSRSSLLLLMWWISVRWLVRPSLLLPALRLSVRRTLPRLSWHPPRTKHPRKDFADHVVRFSDKVEIHLLLDPLKSKSSR
jgi:hypothetical protein